MPTEPHRSESETQAIYERDLLMEAADDMRHHQRAYFQHRSPSSLTAARAAEKRFDTLLAEMTRRHKQPNLFGSE